MNRTMTVLLLVLVSVSAAFAQAPTPAAPAPAATPAATDTSNEIVVAPQAFDNDSDSTKFTEYRDFQDGVFLDRLRYGAVFGATSLRLLGRNGGRDDQQFDLSLGDDASWRAFLNWNQIPHRITNRAFSPYTYEGDGFYSVPGNVGILTTTADGAKYLPVDAAVNDQKIINYLNANLHQLPEIGTERRRGTLGFSYNPFAAMELGVSYTREAKEGDRTSFGTLGDRPPRTLNVELPEPVDFEQNDLRAQFGYATPRYQLQFEFAAPKFENNVDSMRWQSMYFGPDADGSTSYNNDVILAGDAINRRAVSLVGQRALMPDNRYPNATLTFGLNTPLKGRFTATAMAGRMEQDATLLPYSYSTLTKDWNSTAKLPRLTADAKIETVMVNLGYAFVPVKNLNVRAFARTYGLDNQTPAANWWYTTQDAATPTGGVPYKSKRINLDYGYDRSNAGVEASYRFGKSLFGLQVEREAFDRDHREADTTEDTVTVRFSHNPVSWFGLRARAGIGRRDAGTYDWKASSESYWYDAAEVNDGDNPRFGFVNDPDLRRFDVSDRDRKSANVVASITPSEALSFSATFNWRDDDFDSGVESIIPLAGTAFAGRNSETVGIQTGLLASTSRALGFDATYAPTERWSVNAFVTRENLAYDESGSGFDDAEKTNNQEDLIGTAGKSWADPGNRWLANTDDVTTTYGVGGTFDLIPQRLTFTGDFAWSKGTVNIDYSGYGVDKPLNTTYFAFRSPEEAFNRQRTANLGLEYQIRTSLSLGVHYLYEHWDTADWMLDATGGWDEYAGSEYFVRDTTRDNRWGNRLPRLGSYLAPGYGANVAWLTLGYHF